MVKISSSLALAPVVLTSMVSNCLAAQVTQRIFDYEITRNPEFPEDQKWGNLGEAVEISNEHLVVASGRTCRTLETENNEVKTQEVCAPSVVVFDADSTARQAILEPTFDSLKTLDLEIEEGSDEAAYRAKFAQDYKFGADVAIWDDLIAVGCPAYFKGEDASALGRVFIFDTRGNELQVIYSQDNTNTVFDEYGFSVDMKGDYLVVGAPNDGEFNQEIELPELGAFNVTGSPNPGAVYLYKLTGNKENPFVPARRLASPSPRGTDAFGYAVSLSPSDNHLIAVGAPFADYEDCIQTGPDTEECSVSMEDAGEVYIYEADGTLLERISAGVLAKRNGNFGISVDQSANGLLVVGTTEEEVYVWDESDISNIRFNIRITEAQTDLETSDSFGTDVAINKDNIVAIGARTFDSRDNQGEAVGKVYLYDAVTGIYMNSLYSKVSRPYANFGHRVAIAADDYMVITAPMEDLKMERSATSEWVAPGALYFFKLKEDDPNANSGMMTLAWVLVGLLGAVLAFTLFLLFKKVNNSEKHLPLNNM